MTPATVFFSHGKESGPWGLKIRALARVAEKFSCRVVSLDDQGVFDPEVRVGRLIAAARDCSGPVILVGSSMGGYVASVASAALKPKGLFLMAPAIGLPGYAIEKPAPVAEEMVVVHGWDDILVPLEPVFAFARDTRAVFCLIPAGHSLNEQIALVEELFTGFLSRCLSGQPHGVERERLLASL